jgi:hypothetical protein
MLSRDAVRWPLCSGTEVVTMDENEGAVAEAVPQAADVDDARAAARRVAERTQRAQPGEVEVIEDAYRESLDAVGAGAGSDEDVATATEWLLSDEQVVNTRKMRVRLGGSDDEPVMGGWVIRAIGVDVIRSAEREAQGNRQQRRQGQEYDELKANLRVVAEGTIEPDLKAIARQKGIADATVLLRQRFQYRSGVIAQIAGEIMSLSGFDFEDVKAAGNS